MASMVTAMTMTKNTKVWRMNWNNTVPNFMGNLIAVDINEPGRDPWFSDTWDGPWALTRSLGHQWKWNLLSFVYYHHHVQRNIFSLDCLETLPELVFICYGAVQIFWRLIDLKTSAGITNNWKELQTSIKLAGNNKSEPPPFSLGCVTSPVRFQEWIARAGV